MIVGLTFFSSEWPNKHCRTKCCRNPAIFLNRLRVGKKSVSHPVNVCRRAPSVNALSAANPMRGRAVAAICADENRRINFTPEIFEQSRKQKDCAGDVMRKLAQEQPRLATIDKHQFR